MPAGKEGHERAASSRPLGRRCAHYRAQSRNARQPQWPPQYGRLPTDIRACARDPPRGSAARAAMRSAVTWVGAQLTLLYCVNEVVPAAECATPLRSAPARNGAEQAGLRKRDWDRGQHRHRREAGAAHRCRNAAMSRRIRSALLVASPMPGEPTAPPQRARLNRDRLSMLG